MTNEQINKMLADHPDVHVFEWDGQCHDCGDDVKIIYCFDDERKKVTDMFGGVVYLPEQMNEYFYKCIGCYEADPVLKDYQKCEVYTRIVGYMRPMDSWNNSKINEYKMRKKFDLNLIK